MTPNNVIHSYEVGFKMRELARLTGICSEEEAFIIGYLHDIGKEFLKERPMYIHNKVGEKVLKIIGLSYADIVGAHGDPDSVLLHNPIVKMLNYCNLTVDHDGTSVTVEERISGVIERYGVNSKQYKDVIQIVDSLNQGDWTIKDFEEYSGVDNVTK